MSLKINVNKNKVLVASKHQKANIEVKVNRKVVKFK